jgi:hypothetical protein
VCGFCVSLVFHAGRRVRGTREAWSYSVTFDASGLASGIYFYRLREGGYVRTRAMLLLR